MHASNPQRLLDNHYPYPVHQQELAAESCKFEIYLYSYP